MIKLIKLILNILIQNIIKFTVIIYYIKSLSKYKLSLREKIKKKNKKKLFKFK